MRHVLATMLAIRVVLAVAASCYFGFFAAVPVTNCWTRYGEEAAAAGLTPIFGVLALVGWIALLHAPTRHENQIVACAVIAVILVISVGPLALLVTAPNLAGLPTIDLGCAPSLARWALASASCFTAILAPAVASAIVRLLPVNRYRLPIAAFGGSAVWAAYLVLISPL
jgi:hypothetical protein